jgi:hypothetical protein
LSPSTTPGLLTLTRTKRVIRQDAPCLRYVALGDTAVRIVAIEHWVRTLDLDYIIVPPAKADLLPLWHDVFGADRVVAGDRIPASHALADVSSPTDLDWRYGAAAWNVFESVLWELGYFQTRGTRITPPIIYRANHQAKAVMIYPAETTDGNRVFDSDWWIRTCADIRKAGFKINLLGRVDHAPLKKLFDSVTFDQIYPPRIQGIRDCVANSSCAIGSSTGPTWALLLSDIPQIVLESKKSPHGYWHFDRCQEMLTKRLHILTSLETLLRVIA